MSLRSTAVGQMVSSDMKSGGNLSLNDFVSAQVEQLKKVLADHPPHPLEKISQILGILNNIHVRKQKECQRREGLTSENCQYFFWFSNAMKVIVSIIHGLTVTTSDMRECLDQRSADDLRWTKTNINRVMVNLRQLTKIVNGLVNEAPTKESTYSSFQSHQDTHRILVVSISQLESELTFLLRQENFREFISKMSTAKILLDCPDKHCGVCLVQNLTVDLDFTVLDSCQHVFCTSCITTWLEKQKWCPVCRRTVNCTANYKSTNISRFKDKVIEAKAMFKSSLDHILKRTFLHRSDF